MRTGVLGALVASGGCIGGGSNNSNEVMAGPDGNFVFAPETVEISVGETVTWTFESAGHNVSAKPKDHPEVEIPDGAEPFASYEGHKSYQIVPKGESYAHPFETAGEYTYVCIPHTSSGMIGTVTVSE